jgi:hypothetical protein
MKKPKKFALAEAMATPEGREARKKISEALGKVRSQKTEKK